MGTAAQLFTKSMLIGLDSSLQKKQFDDEDLISEIENLPYEEAVEYLSKRSILKKDDYYKLSDKLKFRAFTVGRINDGRLSDKLNAEMIKNVNDGKGLKDFLALTKTDILNKIGMGPNQGWYWETVYRTNVQTAYNVGRAMGFEEDPPIALEFVGIDDARQTDTCASASGTIRPYKDPFWQTHTPPLHFKCRSTLRGIYDESELPEKWSNVGDVETAAKGFGSWPTENDSWWEELASQTRAAKYYGVQGEILGAKEIFIKHKTISEIKKIGTISKGDVMTFDEADGGKSNPFVSLKNGFIENCQACVASFEARMRGFKVRAKEYSKLDIHFKRLANNPARAFIDPYTRHHPKWLESEVFNTWEDCLTYAKKTVKREQRYVMQFHWKKKEQGHIISVIRTKKGRLFFYDPQDGSIWDKEDFEDLFKNILFENKYKQPQFLRVDHLQLDENVLKYVLEATDE